jgi:hypothetical protein
VLRPRLRMPLWAAVAVVAAAYMVRSLLRGWDFRPDMPIDAVLGTTLVALLALRWGLARSASTDEGGGESDGEMPHQHRASHDPRDNDQFGSGVES